MPAHRVTGSRAHATAAGRAEPAPTGAAPQISRSTRQNSSLASVGWQALLEQADREGVPQQPSPAAGQALNAGAHISRSRRSRPVAPPPARDAPQDVAAANGAAAGARLPSTRATSATTTSRRPTAAQRRAASAAAMVRARRDSVQQAPPPTMSSLGSGIPSVLDRQDVPEPPHVHEITAPSPTTPDRPFVMVLTGAPCAGKTSALGFIEALFKDQGFHVVKVEEVASKFFADIGGVEVDSRRHDLCDAVELLRSGRTRG